MLTESHGADAAPAEDGDQADLAARMTTLPLAVLTEIVRFRDHVEILKEEETNDAKTRTQKQI